MDALLGVHALEFTISTFVSFHRVKKKYQFSQYIPPLLSSEVCFKGAGRSLTFLKSQHHSLTQFNCLIKIESKSHQIYDDVVFVSGHVTLA